MPVTKATQEVISPNICTTDTTQTITGVKTFSNAIVGNVNGDIYASDGTTKVLENGTGANATFTGNVTGNITATNISTTNLVNGTSLCFRNKIINGAMTIDQRNAGASVTPADSHYMLDRWRYGTDVASKFSCQQSSTAPAIFVNSMLWTSLSAYSIGASERFVVLQRVEGLNVYDLAWGTASAKTVTLSFWVRSSLTGTFGGAIRNSAQNRGYTFSYTISSANTWEQKTITIVGDTSGTWLTTNGVGLDLVFALGVGSSGVGTPGSWGSTVYLAPTGQVNVVGTNGATFYITGVQLEAGSVATPFENRPIGTELALCQRYYELFNSNNPGITGTSRYAVVKRATPTVTRTGNWNSLTEAGTTVLLNESSQVLLNNSGGTFTGGTFTASAEL